MALTSTNTQGFEFVRHVAADERMWIPGDPGDTYTQGNLVTMTQGEGVLDLYAAGDAAGAIGPSPTNKKDRNRKRSKYGVKRPKK